MKELTTLPLVSPGFFGLNTQESGVTLSPNFAEEADNAIIDKHGRMGARKGWSMLTTSGSSALAGNTVDFMMENNNGDGSSTFICAGNNKVFTGGYGDALVDRTPASYAITGGNWYGANLVGIGVLVQEGHEPLVYDATASPVVQKMSTYAGATQSYGTTEYLHHIIGAYGRLWAHDGSTVYWSTDIADGAFPAFNAGTSGTLNIASVLPNSYDKIIALAVHNNFLIILCENNIVVYSGAENPVATTFQLADIIAGVGCSSAGSVQATGNDLLFLAANGVRSLGRLLTENSMPMRDLTKNIRDDVTASKSYEILNGSLKNIRSVYSEINAFYLLSFPASSTVYCLDMRTQLEDGTARCTVWSDYSAGSFLRAVNRAVLIGKEDGVGLYSGYTDNGASYRLRFLSHQLDFGNSNQRKMLKQVKATIKASVNQQFVIKVGTDYTYSLDSYGFVIPAKAAVAEYGITEYGTNAATIAEYTTGIILSDIKSSVAGSGNVVQIGFEADVQGGEVSVQALNCFVKTGRIG